MKKLILAVLCAAVPAAAQVRLQVPGPSLTPIVVPGLSFDGATPLMTPAFTPVPLALIPTPVPALMPALSAAAIGAINTGEFSRAPAWFDAERLTFDALISAEGGGTAVMRYGWRSQYEMTVFAFPGGPSVSFKEYSSNPMGHPKRSFEASLDTAAARKEAANILRAVQTRHPLEARHQAVLEKILVFLDGR